MSICTPPNDGHDHIHRIHLNRLESLSLGIATIPTVLMESVASIAAGADELQVVGHVLDENGAGL